MNGPGIRLAELMGDNQGAGEVGQQNEALMEAQALWGPPKVPDSLGRSGDSSAATHPPPTPSQKAS